MSEPYIQRLFTSRTNNIASDEYVGDEERLWYDPVSNSLRVWTGTPGGRAVGGSGGSSAVADYTTVAPPPTPNGLIWFNPATKELSVATAGTWESVTGATSLSQLTDVEINNPTNGDALIYNQTVNKFENVDINLTGGTANQILVKVSGLDYDYAWEDLIVDPAYTTLIDDSVTNTMYLGEAVPDSLESQPVWRIKKITLDSTGNVEQVRYANGGNFNQIWNNRYSLVYL